MMRLTETLMQLECNSNRNERVTETKADVFPQYSGGSSAKPLAVCFGAAVQMWTIDGAFNQRWIFHVLSDKFLIESRFVALSLERVNGLLLFRHIKRYLPTSVSMHVMPRHLPFPLSYHFIISVHQMEEFLLPDGL